MAFNSNTYRMNKYRRSAWANLAAAKDIKSRLADGTAYPWEAPRISTFVELARSDMRLYLTLKAYKNIGRA